MSSDAFPLTEAQIIGLALECIFYGIYLVTFFYCLQRLVCLSNGNFAFKKKSDVKWPMLVVAILLFIFATFDVAFGLEHDLQAFVFYKGPGGAIEQLYQLTDWVTIMKSIDYFALTSIGDGMLIYRFYIVYGSRVKLILVPMIIWTTCIVTEAGATWKESSIKTGATLNDARIQPWTYATYAMTLTLNTGLTSLIVWKLWKVHSGVSRVAEVVTDRLMHVVRIIIDSALVYTLSVFVLVACNIAKSNALYPVSDVIAQLIGITFNLIIIRSQKDSWSESNRAQLMQENYRLRNIDSTVQYCATLAASQTYNEDTDVKHHERIFVSDRRQSQKSAILKEQIYPVSAV